MISELIGARIRTYTLRLGEMLARRGLTPNALTAIGLMLNLVVAAIIASGHLVAGGVLLLLASGFDMLDGAVARASGTVTKFGGFLDSTLDRYSEAVVLGGVLLYILGTEDYWLGSLLVLTATVGSLMISYARARAEAAGFRASVGLLARPERVVVLAVGLLIGQVIPALVILAVGTQLTVITRMAHVWRLSHPAEPGAS
ncbi:MAG: CDP-alcohol phosphatidyltransferase family protein [Chloroflexota bacterium]|nr:CDP-alcohol phosphatidyltransferase family protein [Chloroflexia bacterium]MDQ3226014.1 CDP-alcohol phosphatidyltransferase family protein [Chloroflexota bacterium]